MPLCFALIAALGFVACMSSEDEETPPANTEDNTATTSSVPPEDPNLNPIIDELTVSNGWPDPVPPTCGLVQETKLSFQVLAHDQDDPADGLLYQWSFKSKPDGSQAFFDDDSAANPSFTPDVAGDYEVEVTVRDTRDGAVSQTVTVQGVFGTAVAGSRRLGC